MKRLSVFATLPSLDSLSLNDSVDQTASDSILANPLVPDKQLDASPEANMFCPSGFSRKDLRSLRRIYRCPRPADADTSTSNPFHWMDKRPRVLDSDLQVAFNRILTSESKTGESIDFAESKREASSRWRKLGGGKQRGKDIQKHVITALQELDDHSLPNAAKKRKEAVQEILTPDLYKTKSCPTRSISWDVGLVLNASAEEKTLDPRRHQSIDSVLLLKREEEDIWSATNNIRSEHIDSSRQLVKDLILKNPVAFSEDMAAQIEQEYRSAAETAHEKLDLLKDCPSNSERAQDFLTSIAVLKLERPFFVAPSIETKKYDLQQEDRQRRSNYYWDVEESFFAERRKENDSKGVFDTEKSLSRQFEIDWERVIAKSRFYRLVGREDAGVRRNDQDIHQEVLEIKEELNSKRDILRSAFIYYSMRNGPASSGCIFQLSLQQWNAFAQECSILDPKSPGVKPADLARMFVSTNFEEDSKTEESEANDDDALVRFEFLEIIVRASLGKYITSKQLNDSSDSVKKLLEDCILPNLPQEARVDPNTFRRERFYSPEMERQVQRNYAFLNSIFKLYKAKDKTKYFSIEHWSSFLESAGLLGDHTGVDKSDANLVFAWSQMIIVDELKKRHRALSLMFFDFIEAIARLADMISPLTKEDLLETNLEKEDSRNSLVFEYFEQAKNGVCEIRRRNSAGLLSKPTRALDEKFSVLMDYLVDALKQVWGGSNKEQVTDRMKKLASKLSGGIELG